MPHPAKVSNCVAGGTFNRSIALRARANQFSTDPQPISIAQVPNERCHGALRKP